MIVRPVCPVFPGKDPPHLTEGGRAREGRKEVADADRAGEGKMY